MRPSAGAPPTTLWVGVGLADPIGEEQGNDGDAVGVQCGQVVVGEPATISQAQVGAVRLEHGTGGIGPAHR